MPRRLGRGTVTARRRAHSRGRIRPRTVVPCAADGRRLRMTGTTPGGLTAGSEITTRRHIYAGGDWVAAATTDTIEVVNPTTELVFGEVPAGSAADVATA